MLSLPPYFGSSEPDVGFPPVNLPPYFGSSEPDVGFPPVNLPPYFFGSSGQYNGLVVAEFGLTAEFGRLRQYKRAGALTDCCPSPIDRTCAAAAEPPIRRAAAMVSARIAMRVMARLASNSTSPWATERMAEQIDFQPLAGFCQRR